MKIDTKFIIRLKSRDEQAFYEIYEYYKKMVFYIAYSILKSHEQAEEVLNDTFYALYRSINDFDEDRASDMQAWITNIAKNRAIDMLRSKKDIIYDNEKIDDLIDSSDTIDDSDNMREIMSVMKEHLEQEDIDIILYKVYYNYSFKDIARLYNESLSTVSSKYSRAIKKIKKHLKENQK